VVNTAQPEQQRRFRFCSFVTSLLILAARRHAPCHFFARCFVACLRDDAAALFRFVTPLPPAIAAAMPPRPPRTLRYARYVAHYFSMSPRHVAAYRHARFTPPLILICYACFCWRLFLLPHAIMLLAILLSSSIILPTNNIAIDISTSLLRSAAAILARLYSSASICLSACTRRPPLSAIFAPLKNSRSATFARLHALSAPRACPRC